MLQKIKRLRTDNKIITKITFALLLVFSIFGMHTLYTFFTYDPFVGNFYECKPKDDDKSTFGTCEALHLDETHFQNVRWKQISLNNAAYVDIPQSWEIQHSTTTTGIYTPENSMIGETILHDSSQKNFFTVYTIPTDIELKKWVSQNTQNADDQVRKYFFKNVISTSPAKFGLLVTEEVLGYDSDCQQYREKTSHYSPTIKWNSQVLATSICFIPPENTITRNWSLFKKESSIIALNCGFNCPQNLVDRIYDSFTPTTFGGLKRIEVLQNVSSESIFLRLPIDWKYDFTTPKTIRIDIPPDPTDTNYYATESFNITYETNDLDLLVMPISVETLTQWQEQIAQKQPTNKNLYIYEIQGEPNIENLKKDQTYENDKAYTHTVSATFEENNKIYVFWDYNFNLYPELSKNRTKYAVYDKNTGDIFTGSMPDTLLKYWRKETFLKIFVDIIDSIEIKKST